MTWLQKRLGFLNFVWAENEDIIDANDTSAFIDLEKMIFVPVARDGSIFNPDVARSGVYQIGAKGEEQNFKSFAETLTALNATPVPRWRRPNDKGHWGIVSGVTWQRIERKW